jgi:hypothetical protein
MGRFSGKPLEGGSSVISDAGGSEKPSSDAGAWTTVTTSRSAGVSIGISSAVTSFASRFESVKKRGRTSPRFSNVITFASSATLVRHRRPSRIGTSTSGNSWMSSAAVLRKKGRGARPPQTRVFAF